MTFQKNQLEVQQKYFSFPQRGKKATSQKVPEAGAALALILLAVINPLGRSRRLSQPQLHRCWLSTKVSEHKSVSTCVVEGALVTI